MKRTALEVVQSQIEACKACPRLVRFREKVAREKRKAYATETYTGRAVAGFGDPNARIIVFGLAPGAHGAEL
jgi:uracil-DNA glycosylase